MDSEGVAKELVAVAGLLTASSIRDSISVLGDDMDGVAVDFNGDESFAYVDDVRAFQKGYFRLRKDFKRKVEDLLDKHS